mmetsp:Transcript_19158/g.60250  ORF Transcript_19158/g.60250 Transcript_19158/m.60250 type:complete len:256 (-) Transcript_19158:54-821(-)
MVGGKATFGHAGMRDRDEGGVVFDKSDLASPVAHVRVADVDDGARVNFEGKTGGSISNTVRTCPFVGEVSEHVSEAEAVVDESRRAREDPDVRPGERGVRTVVVRRRGERHGKRGCDYLEPASLVDNALPAHLEEPASRLALSRVAVGRGSCHLRVELIVPILELLGDVLQVLDVHFPAHSRRSRVFPVATASRRSSSRRHLSPSRQLRPFLGGEVFPLPVLPARASRKALELWSQQTHRVTERLRRRDSVNVDL